MKKRRFMGFMALASCVTLLTGCDSNAFFGLGGKVNEILIKLGLMEEEEKKEVPSSDTKPVDPTPGPQPEPEPEPQPQPGPVTPTGEMIILPLPESLHPGDVLDLDDYVTLKKISGGFTVTVDKGEDLVSQDGHKLTIVGEGELQFTVKAGELSKTFSFDTGYAIREEFVELFDGISNRYTMDIYSPQYDDNDQYIGMGWDDTLYHSSNYVLALTSFGEDEQGKSIPGGILRFSEESDSCYMFELLEGEEGEYVKLLDEYSSKLISYYNNDFSVDFSKARYEYDSEYDIEMLVVEGDDAVTFAENSLFIPNGKLSLQDGTEIPFSRIEFYFEDISEEGEDPLIVPCCDSYVLYQGKNELWNTGVFWLDEQSIGYPLLEEYCVPENEPVPFDYYNDFFEGITLSDLLVSNESVFGADGSYSVSYGWFNDNGQAIAQPSDATNFFDGALPAGVKTRFTSETSIWEVAFDGEEKPYPVSGKTTVNVGTEEEPDMVVYSVFPVEGSYYTEPDYNHETVWDGSLLAFDGLRNPENWELGAITGVEETTFESETAYSFTFRGGKFHGLLYSICDGIEGMSLIEDTIEWYYEVSEGDNLEEFFDMEMLVCPTYGYVQFTIVFAWEEGENYVISVASSYAPSIKDYTQAFEEAINPLCK